MTPLNAIPYGELDSNIRSLVEALNAFPGVDTVGSCGGHASPGPGQYPEGTWYVKFDAAHSEIGWRSLEFVAWVTTDLRRGGEGVILEATSPPPYLNSPGACLAFVLSGKDVDPEFVARFLSDMYADSYIAVGDEDKNKD